MQICTKHEILSEAESMTKWKEPTCIYINIFSRLSLRSIMLLNHILFFKELIRIHFHQCKTFYKKYLNRRKTAL